MINTGIDEELKEKIILAIKKFNSIKKICIFGSRANGKYKYNSDIDIVLYGDIDFETMLEIKNSIEEINTHYSFDIVSYSDIENIKMKENIDKDNLVLYEK